MSHNPSLSFSFYSEPDLYYAKSDYGKTALPQTAYSQARLPRTNFQQQGYQLPQHFAEPVLNSDYDDATAVPQSDFDAFYSDIAPLDSDVDPAYFQIAEPFMSEPGNYSGYANDIEVENANVNVQSDVVNGNRFDPVDLPSSPPAEDLEFNELPSSPPSSPDRTIQPGSTHRARPEEPRMQPLSQAAPLSFDSLGITGFHRPRPSLIIPASSEVTNSSPYVSPQHSPYQSPHRSPPHRAHAQTSPHQSPQRSSHASPQHSPRRVLPHQSPHPMMARSPLMNPPSYSYQPSPYLHPSQHIPASAPDMLESYGLLQPPRFTHQQLLPNLSPSLSETSLSPDPASSPEHVNEFTWQPILTLPKSDHSEAIIEQQRKPKLKRKSRLPDGVVDEYVGTTDEEHVYVCLYPNCNRLFKRTYNLRSHIQTHLCDRPYTCSLCSANFVRPHDLRRHERCHSLAKPFVCPCGKGFNRQDAMQRHRLRDICVGGIASGVPKSPKPRGRPKGRKNTPSSSPEMGDRSPTNDSSPDQMGVSSQRFEGMPPQLTRTPNLSYPETL